MRIKLAGFTLALALLIAGCGGSHAVSVAKSPRAQADQKKAQAIVQGCISKGNFLTKPGRKAVITCIAPKGKEAAVEKCVQGEFAKHGIWTKKRRAQFFQGIVTCVEANR